MFRLIHAQTVTGPILVDDIDDGLPNKEIHCGHIGDPKAVRRDGYANRVKQKCYIPRLKPGSTTIAGYIDLNETDAVIHSRGRGKIAKLESAGLITVVSLVAGDLVAPTVTGNTIGAPAAGDLTITGTKMASVSPNSTRVHLFGAGVGDVTLTQAQIVAVSPGAVSDTSIVIDSTLIPGVAAGDSVVVTADDLASNTFVLV